MKNETLFKFIVSNLGLSVKKGTKIQAEVTCPYCGKDNDNHFHCSVGQIFSDRGWGFHCFSCGESASLVRFCKDIQLDIPENDLKLENELKNVRIPEPDKNPADWLEHVDLFMLQALGHPNRYESWKSYKNFSEGLVDKYNLGYGTMPKFRGRWLITPIFSIAGEIQTLRGRQLESGGWISAPGVPISNIDLPLVGRVNRGDVVFVVENYPDAILINETTDYKAVSSLSVSNWFDRWSNQLRQRLPSLVVVAYDADLAGNGINDKRLIAGEIISRLKKNGDSEKVRLRKLTSYDYGFMYEYSMGPDSPWIKGKIPGLRGKKLADELQSKGLPAYKVEWPKSLFKKDVGDILCSKQQEIGRSLIG